MSLKYGKYGIWVQPYVHPDVENIDRKLVYLLNRLPGRRNRPLYICVRSYQSWLEIAVEAIGAQPGDHQAEMVRHLTIANRVKQTHPLHARNGTHAEPTAPIAQVENAQSLELSDIELHPRTDFVPRIKKPPKSDGYFGIFMTRKRITDNLDVLLNVLPPLMAKQLPSLIGQMIY